MSGFGLLSVAVRITAAVLVTLLMLVLLVVPSVLLGDSLVSGARSIVDSFQRGELHIPPPPDSVAAWPLIGEPIAKSWTLASENLEQALRQASPLFKGFGRWLLSAAAGAGLALLQFLIAIVIAGALLANSGAAGRMTRAVAKRLAGEKGLEFASIAERTVRSVASGIWGRPHTGAACRIGFSGGRRSSRGAAYLGLPCFWRDPIGRRDRADPCRDLHLRRCDRWFSQRGDHRPIYRRRCLSPRLQALSRLAGTGLDTPL